MTSNVSFDWAPSLRRCPWSLLADEDEVWVLIDLWQDVELLGENALPHPGGVMEQHAFAYEALRKCAQTKADVLSERLRRTQKGRSE